MDVLKVFSQHFSLRIRGRASSRGDLNVAPTSARQSLVCLATSSAIFDDERDPVADHFGRWLQTLACGRHSSICARTHGRLEAGRTLRLGAVISLGLRAEHKMT